MVWALSDLASPGTAIVDREGLTERRARLRQRREDLDAALFFHDDEIADLDALQEETDSEQYDICSSPNCQVHYFLTLTSPYLRLHVKSSRTTLTNQQAHLVRDLERIYPIEPISSPDLLFGILDIPLPIPTNPSDPAPPLSHPEWPSINEENVATALGYTAQVVLALSVYLSIVIPYPIVCAGSRSVVKDPISHMHGPRT